MALLHTPAPQHVMQLVVLVLHVVHVCVNYGDIVFSDKGSVLTSHHTSFLSTVFRVLGRVVHILCTCIFVCVQTSGSQKCCCVTIHCIVWSHLWMTFSCCLLFCLQFFVWYCLWCCLLVSQARPLLPLHCYILTTSLCNNGISCLWCCLWCCLCCFLWCCWLLLFARLWCSRCVWRDWSTPRQTLWESR